MQASSNPLRFFADGFSKLTGNVPLSWQKRLFVEHFIRSDIPSCLDIPTGLGKTSVIAVWLLARAYRSAGRRPPLPNRLVYVVDRRAVVDQATTEAKLLRDGLEHAPDLKGALELGSRPLLISTLRGQYADNRDWLEDPAAPAIIVGTVDMIGSRLLFSGYGVSRKLRPYQAGLLGVDTLLVLDESHLVPPFEKLMATIAGDGAALGPSDTQCQDVILPFKLKLLSLSATGRKRGGWIFRLEDDDRSDELVRKRLEAKKWAKAVAADGRKLDVALADEAWKLAEQAGRPIRCLVYCNSRDVAEKVCDTLAKRGKKDVETELFVGGRRVWERKKAAEKLEELGFLAGSGVERNRHAFLIATSAGEVGVDLDADHMVCDLAPWERMVQRLGRVNRRGDGDARIVVVHEGEPKPKKPEEPKPEEVRAGIGWRSLALLGRLPRHEHGHDASPAALAALKTDHADEVKQATTLEPLHPALTRALVDAWSMTSLEVHTGRPEVAPWLRGWIEDEPQTTLVWRTYLPVRPRKGSATDREVDDNLREIDDFFEAAPPHLTEKLQTEAWRVVKWLSARAEKLTKTIQTGVDSTGGEIFALSRVERESVVAVALDQSGHFTKAFRLADLHPEGNAKKHADSLVRMLRDRILIVDARLGGLSAAGLLDTDADGAVTSDGDAPWDEVGFRIESVAAEAERTKGAERAKPFYFVTERDDEGEAVRFLVVEKTRSRSTSEEDRALSPRPQLLAEHQNWAAARARALARSLGLNADLAAALEIAARLHDEGKQAKRWQSAFNACADGIYAKTKGPVRTRHLDGYRHEFGSLFHAEKDEAFSNLPAEMQDLVLHLIAAHHGRARPTISTRGCEEGPPSVLEDHARDVALRFARLNARWGPWGLAWLEALLRAADQQASRDNDRGEQPDG